MNSGFPSASVPMHLFVQTIDIQRESIALDSGGSPIRSFNVHFSSVPANVQPQSQAFFDPSTNRRIYKQSLRIYLDPRLDILPTDRITFQSQSYEQTTSSEDLLASSVVRRIECRQIAE